MGREEGGETWWPCIAVFTACGGSERDLQLDLRVTKRGFKVRLGFKLQVGDRAAGRQPQLQAVVARQWQRREAWHPRAHWRHAQSHLRLGNAGPRAECAQRSAWIGGVQDGEAQQRRLLPHAAREAEQARVWRVARRVRVAHGREEHQPRGGRRGHARDNTQRSVQHRERLEAAPRHCEED